MGGGGYVGRKAYSALKSPPLSTHWWQVWFCSSWGMCCAASLFFKRSHCRGVIHSCQVDRFNGDEQMMCNKFAMLNTRLLRNMPDTSGQKWWEDSPCLLCRVFAQSEHDENEWAWVWVIWSPNWTWCPQTLTKRVCSSVHFFRAYFCIKEPVNV